MATRVKELKIATIVFFLVVQKLLTNLNVLALLYGCVFLFGCSSRNDFFSDQWATFTFDSLVKWIDLLTNSLFNSESQIKMVDRQIVKWQNELFHFALLNYLVQRREKFV